MKFFRKKRKATSTMSRDINIDLTGDLSDNDPDDLRYALDRGLFDAADASRVFNYLNGVDDSDSAHEHSVDPEEMEELLALLNGSVGEVNDKVDEVELTERDLEILVEQEKANKNRKGVLEHLEGLLEDLRAEPEPEPGDEA